MRCHPALNPPCCHHEEVRSRSSREPMTRGLLLFFGVHPRFRGGQHLNWRPVVITSESASSGRSEESAVTFIAFVELSPHAGAPPSPARAPLAPKKPGMDLSCLVASSLPRSTNPLSSRGSSLAFLTRANDEGSAFVFLECTLVLGGTTPQLATRCHHERVRQQRTKRGICSWVSAE